MLTEKQFAKIMRQVCLVIRKKTAQSLLLGNDTGCFSTEQYKERYIKLRTEEVDHPKEDEVVKILNVFCGEDWGRRHLFSIPDIVREIKPDVWIGIEG